MKVFGLSFSDMCDIERTEKQTLLEKGALVYSTTSVESCGNLNGIRRIERRIVVYNSRFYLIQILHMPIYVFTGTWRIYGKNDECPKRVRRVSGTNDAREDEEGERVWTYDNSRFRPPHVEWATDSLRQMVWAERSAIRRYRKELLKGE